LQVLAGIVDPDPQPHPDAQERLVAELDGGAATSSVTIEGEQPGPPEAVEDRVGRDRVEVQRRELAPRDPAAAVGGVLAGVYER
jgi:hypothetical protein